MPAECDDDQGLDNKKSKPQCTKTPVNSPKSEDWDQEFEEELRGGASCEAKGVAKSKKSPLLMSLFNVDGEGNLLDEMGEVID